MFRSGSPAEGLVLRDGTQGSAHPRRAPGAAEGCWWAGALTLTVPPALACWMARLEDQVQLELEDGLLEQLRGGGGGARAPGGGEQLRERGGGGSTQGEQGEEETVPTRNSQSQYHTLTHKNSSFPQSFPSPILHPMSQC